MTENAKQIKQLIAQLNTAISEEEGWEPKTARDYGVLTWAKVVRIEKHIENLEGLYDRVKALEGNQGLLAGLQGVFTIIAATLAGYFGSRH